jgi:hypothetical protein
MPDSEAKPHNFRVRKLEAREAGKLAGFHIPVYG